MPETDSNGLLSPPRRSRVQRQRSSSLPITEEIEVTATEAAIMFAAEKAATSRRRANSTGRQRQRRRRRPQSADEARDVPLSRDARDGDGDGDSAPGEDLQLQPSSQPRINATRTRPPDAVQAKHELVTGIVSEELHALLPHHLATPPNPLNTYSANLARFIQSRIDSIRSAIPAPPLSPSSPCSCPELSQFCLFPDPPSPSNQSDHSNHSHPSSPSSSINPVHRSTFRNTNDLNIALPDSFPMRPPLRSTFSNWSSTSSCNSPTAWEDEPLPSPPVLNPDSIASTPSILELYGSITSRSGIFTSTPLDEAVQEEAEGSTEDAMLRHESLGRDGSATEQPRPASMPLSHPSASSQATADPNSAPTMPSFLHPSYFSPRPCSRSQGAACSPSASASKTLTAISPYEGNALTRVVDILVQAPNRVIVEGMTFEMVG